METIPYCIKMVYFLLYLIVFLLVPLSGVTGLLDDIPFLHMCI